MSDNTYLPDTFLNLVEVSAALRLDPRSVRRIAYELGGKRVGRCWRFRWGTVMEYFNDANIKKGSWKRLAGQGDNRWGSGGNQVLPCGQIERPGMAGRKEMGDTEEKRNFGKIRPTGSDAHGLRAALGLG